MEIWNSSKTNIMKLHRHKHEVACVYSKVNITTDNNHLLMQIMQDIAKSMV